MIVRPEPDGSLLLIGQTDHSRFVGQLAAHWGNGDFATPRPFESVVRAATFHDFGWLRYETAPLVDPKTGTPYQFLHVPLTETQLGAYQWSLDWMTDIDPYAGLIVSMHRTGLWRGRYETVKHPRGYNLPSLSPEVQALVERNEAWQEQERRRHDEAEVWTNYRLMQTWDLLGLYFGCHDPCEDHVEPVPTGYAADSPTVSLALTPLGPRHVRFAPYPFDTRPCRVQLAARRVPARVFPDVESFRRAYFQAPVELMEFELN
jgi:uncharacterized protein DUF3891